MESEFKEIWDRIMGQEIIKDVLRDFKRVDLMCSECEKIIIMFGAIFQCNQQNRVFCSRECSEIWVKRYPKGKKKWKLIEVDE